MSEIKKGDLVAVVRCCCSEFLQGTWLFSVEDVHQFGNCECRNCGTILPDGLYAGDNQTCVGAPLSWLRKIDPDQASEHDLKGAKLDKRDKEFA